MANRKQIEIKDGKIPNNDNIEMVIELPSYHKNKWYNFFMITWYWNEKETLYVYFLNFMMKIGLLDADTREKGIMFQITPRIGIRLSTSRITMVEHALFKLMAYEFNKKEKKEKTKP